MELNAMTEKRASRRFAAFRSPFYCQEGDNGDADMSVSDVSSAGVGIVTNKKVAEGDRIKLELMVPGDDVPMFVIAEVVWAAREPDAVRNYCAGFHFAAMHPSDKKRLVNYIYSSFVRQP
ncbi:MAG: PilZ domain-containing protein [Candidatus Omnitrophica bacterium]|nr:PilZ domain-containing protein [Candidatus Omnitrophota bacterium]